VLRGSSLPQSSWYGALHQGGSDEHDVSFPPRPWADLTDDDVAEIGRVGRSWIADRARKHRL
jgi:phage gpG-like protein